MNEFRNFLKETLENWGMDLTEERFSQFSRFYDLIIETNRVMNLTTITEPKDVIEKHFIDSLSVAQFLDMDFIGSMVDVGTGAGFPGIPVKIMFPEINMVLVDSLNKRVKFLNTVIDELGLKNVVAIHGRAEELARKSEYREKFDLCVSRAVANLSTLSELCMPFVRVGGMFVSYKSGKISEEFSSAKKAIKILGGGDSSVERFLLEGSDAERSFVMISKSVSTPKKYPRKPGLPAKEPIL